MFLTLLRLTTSSPLTCFTALSTVWVRTFRSSTATAMAKRWKEKSEVPFQSDLKNPVDVIHGGDNTYTEFGTVYDKKPFRVDVKKYHLYTWCGCGISSLQPYCDGKACVHPQLRRRIKAGPVKYIAPEDREVWFCNCKQTKHRPFCDGSHRSEEVQEKTIPSKFDIWEPRVVPK